MSPEFLPFAMAALAGLVGGVWGFMEIVDEFKIESPRTFATGGAWLLVAVNFFAAAIVFLILISIAPAMQNWLSAFLTGLAWPTIFRNTSLKLSQPLDDQKSRETAAIRVEQAYASTQKLAMQLINGQLTSQRNRLLVKVRSNPAEIAAFAKNQIVLSPQQEDSEKATQFVDAIVLRAITDEEKKAYLIALILNRFGRATLEDFIRQSAK
ncbi:MAG TPA: hypothetical protein PL141_08155 [Thermoflexales bacterium]|nr:hypothetical protein [Thermoflexales bacterium]HQW36888.1 hypothetical protein [Thermoflexales bacterium]